VPEVGAVAFLPPKKLGAVARCRMVGAVAFLPPKELGAVARCRMVGAVAFLPPKNIMSELLNSFRSRLCSSPGGRNATETLPPAPLPHPYTPSSVMTGLPDFGTSGLL